MKTMDNTLMKNIKMVNLLHDPKTRGQVCWSIGKFISNIGHLCRNVDKKLNPEHSVLGLDGKPDGVGDVPVLRDPQQLVWPEQY